MLTIKQYIYTLYKPLTILSLGAANFFLAFGVWTCSAWFLLPGPVGCFWDPIFFFWRLVPGLKPFATCTCCERQIFCFI